MPRLGFVVIHKLLVELRRGIGHCCDLCDPLCLERVGRFRFISLAASHVRSNRFHLLYFNNARISSVSLSLGRSIAGSTAAGRIES